MRYLLPSKEQSPYFYPQNPRRRQNYNKGFLISHLPNLCASARSSLKKKDLPFIHLVPAEVTTRANMA